MGFSKTLSDDAKRRLKLAGFILPTAMESAPPVTAHATYQAMDAMPYRGNCRQSRARARCSSAEPTSLPATAGSFASSTAQTPATEAPPEIHAPPRSTGSSSASFDVPRVSAKPFSPSAFFKSKLHGASPRSPPQSPPPSGPRVIFIDCQSLPPSS